MAKYPSLRPSLPIVTAAIRCITKQLTPQQLSETFIYEEEYKEEDQTTQDEEMQRKVNPFSYDEELEREDDQATDKKIDSRDDVITYDEELDIDDLIT